MPRYKVEFACDWQPRKIQNVEGMLRKFLANCGGVAGVDQVRMVPLDAAEESTKPKTFRLRCTRFIKNEMRACGYVRDVLQFEPCPKCGGRAGQEKVDPALVKTEQEIAEAQARAIEQAAAGKDDDLKPAGSNAALPLPSEAPAADTPPGA